MKFLITLIAGLLVSSFTYASVTTPSDLMFRKDKKTLKYSEDTTGVMFRAVPKAKKKLK